MEGVSSVERSQKKSIMMNHARKEIGVEEAIDYLKSIMLHLEKILMVEVWSFQISILEQIIGIRLRGSMMIQRLNEI